MKSTYPEAIAVSVIWIVAGVLSYFIKDTTPVLLAMWATVAICFIGL